MLLAHASYRTSSDAHEHSGPSCPRYARGITTDSIRTPAERIRVVTAATTGRRGSGFYLCKGAFSCRFVQTFGDPIVFSKSATDS